MALSEESIRGTAKAAFEAALHGRRCRLCGLANPVHRVCCDSYICNACFYHELREDNTLRQSLLEDATDWPLRVHCPQCHEPLGQSAGFEAKIESTGKALSRRDLCAVRYCVALCALMWSVAILLGALARGPAHKISWHGDECEASGPKFCGNMSALMDYNDAMVLQGRRLPWSYVPPAGQWRSEVSTCDANETSTNKVQQCYCTSTCVVDMCLYEATGGLSGWDITEDEAELPPRRLVFEDGFEVSGLAPSDDEIARVADTLSPLWALVEGAMHSSGCGAKANHGLRFGGPNMRRLVTAPMDTASGGTWSFDMAYGSGTSACPALAFGTVVLSYAHDPTACSFSLGDVHTGLADIGWLNQSFPTQPHFPPYIQSKHTTIDADGLFGMLTALGKTGGDLAISAVELRAHRPPSKRGIILPTIDPLLTNDMDLRSTAFSSSLYSAGQENDTGALLHLLDQLISDGWRVPPPFTIDPSPGVVNRMFQLPLATSSLESHIEQLQWKTMAQFSRQQYQRGPYQLSSATVRVPADARGNCVRFMWHQPRYWDGFDAWVIDNAQYWQGAPSLGAMAAATKVSQSRMTACTSGCGPCSTSVKTQGEPQPAPSQQCRELQHSGVLCSLMVAGAFSLFCLGVGLCESCTQILGAGDLIYLLFACCCRRIPAAVYDAGSFCCTRHRGVRVYPSELQLAPQVTTKSAKAKTTHATKRASGNKSSAPLTEVPHEITDLSHIDNGEKLEEGVKFVELVLGSHVEEAECNGLVLAPAPAEHSDPQSKNHKTEVIQHRSNTNKPEDTIIIGSQWFATFVVLFFIAGVSATWAISFAIMPAKQPTSFSGCIAFGIGTLRTRFPDFVLWLAAIAADGAFVMAVGIATFSSTASGCFDAIAACSVCKPRILRTPAKVVPTTAATDWWRQITQRHTGILLGFPVRSNAVTISSVERIDEGWRFSGIALLLYYIVLSTPFATILVMLEGSATLTPSGTRALVVCTCVKAFLGPHFILHFVWFISNCTVSSIKYVVLSMFSFLRQMCQCLNSSAKIHVQEDDIEEPDAPAANVAGTTPPSPKRVVPPVVLVKYSRAFCSFRARRLAALWSAFGAALAIILVCIVSLLLRSDLEQATIAGYKIYTLLIALCCSLPAVLAVFGYVYGALLCLPICWYISLTGFKQPTIVEFQWSRSSEMATRFPCCMPCGEGPEVGRPPTPALCAGNCTPLLDITAKMGGCLPPARDHCHLRSNPTHTAQWIVYDLGAAESDKLRKNLKVVEVFDAEYAGKPRDVEDTSGSSTRVDDSSASLP